jgi:hypothetical protein
MNENTVLTGTLLGNDDLGDEVTTVTAFDSASVNGGVVTVDAAGNFNYTPATDFVGADTFTYTITDADGDTSTAEVTVNVANVNALPDAVDDSYNVIEGQSVGGNVITNLGGTDTDGDGVGTLKITHIGDFSISGPATFTIIDGVLNEVDVLLLDDALFSGTNDNGILSIDTDGEFTYENKGFLEGPTSTQPVFEYTLSDGTDTDTAKVTIEVSTNAPDANNDSNFILLTKVNGTDTAFSSGVKGSVVAGGSSGDSADTSINGFGTPVVTQIIYDGDTYLFSDTVTSHDINTEYGTLTIDNAGAYVFVTIGGMPLPRVNMELKFEYTIQDGDLVNPETDSATLTINIAIPSAPETSGKSVDMAVDETSGTIDTSFATKALLSDDEAAFLHSQDTDDLSDILTDGHSEGLEKYLTVIGENEGAMLNIDQAAVLNNAQADESIVLEKRGADSENAPTTTVTNGLLSGGAIIISDASAATNAPITELDSSELL